MKFSYYGILILTILNIHHITCIETVGAELVELRKKLLEKSNFPNVKSSNVHYMDVFYKNKKVLVTGGAGFIGSHLVDALVAYGAQVTVLDDLSTGYLSNILHNEQKINFIKGSVTDVLVCQQACQGQDIVFHCAAMVLVAESENAPHKCNDINCQGTFNVLSAAKKANCHAVVFSSSAAVYGSREGRFNEADYCEPASIYGLTKLLGEHYCRLFSRVYNTGTVCLRYFNVFGSRQRSNSPYCGAIALFNKKMQNNEPIIIYGNGQQTRDFVPVDIVVQANLLAATLPKAELHGQAINVGLGQPISIIDLVQLLAQQFPFYKEQVLYQEARAGDVRHSVADNRRLHALFSSN